MKLIKKFNLQKKFRAQRTRAAIRGTAARPRLSVFRSNRGTYAQLIDDQSGRTLVGLSTKNIKTKTAKTGLAKELGKELAKKAKEAGVAAAVFDRGAYKFHGRVKAVAEGAREGGLKF